MYQSYIFLSHQRKFVSPEFQEIATDSSCAIYKHEFVLCVDKTCGISECFIYPYSNIIHTFCCVGATEGTSHIQTWLLSRCQGIKFVKLV